MTVKTVSLCEKQHKIGEFDALISNFGCNLPISTQKTNKLAKIYVRNKYD